MIELTNFVTQMSVIECMYGHFVICLFTKKLTSHKSKTIIRNSAQKIKIEQYKSDRK